MDSKVEWYVPWYYRYYDSEIIICELGLDYGFFPRALGLGKLPASGLTPLVMIRLYPIGHFDTY